MRKNLRENLQKDRCLVLRYYVEKKPYPLWSLRSIFWPSKSRNSWKAGVICRLPKSCSSVSWPARWWRTPNLNLETKACSSYRATKVPAPGHMTGIRELTFRDSLIACEKNIPRWHVIDYEKARQGLFCVSSHRHVSLSLSFFFFSLPLASSYDHDHARNS